jgi:uncharacterized coiled-coil DUF342 family protein
MTTPDELRKLADNLWPRDAKAQVAIHETAAEIERLQARVAKLEEALETYAQYSRNGEVSFVSGALARNALEEK